MAELTRITTYPIKALDGEDRDAVTITEGGVLGDDRRYAIVDGPAEADFDPMTASTAADGDYINAKRTAAVHRLETDIDADGETVTVGVHGDPETWTFDLADRAALDAWLSDYFDRPVSVRRYETGGHQDYHKYGLSGPSVISTATLRAVASWFPGLDVDNVRRRMRANLEVDGVEPFWEDRLVADHGEAVAFRIGDVRLLGIEPCVRCVVPTRDPTTGAVDEDFRETFIRRRRETRPPWQDSDRFEGDFRLMTITHVPESAWGERLAVGDEIAIDGRVDLDPAAAT